MNETAKMLAKSADIISQLIEYGEDANNLLRECAAQFRFYEANHRAKNTEDSLAKAEVNRLLAEKIEKFLNVR